jgi:hypothetical protein
MAGRNVPRWDWYRTSGGRMAGRKNKNKQSYATSPLLNLAPDSYLERTSRPLYAIVFLIPFIVFYEFGTIFINTDVLNHSQVRVVAFVWLQDFLAYVGISNRLVWAAPPMVVIVILLGLQVASRKPWYFCFGDFIPMLAECVLLAIPLIVLSLVFRNAPQANHGSAAWSGEKVVYAQAHVGEPCQSLSASTGSSLSGAPSETRVGEHLLMANIVTGVGAGIYEELVFRLILICALMVLFQDVLGLSHTSAAVVSVLISAALFSAHHHIVFVDGRFQAGDQFSLGKFVFRTAAGVYFALLFAIRGFGITAGTHALYDIIGTVANAVFFDT